MEHLQASSEFVGVKRDLLRLSREEELAVKCGRNFADITESAFSVEEGYSLSLQANLTRPNHFLESNEILF